MSNGKCFRNEWKNTKLLQTKIGDTMKSQINILKLKNTVTKVKTSLGGLSSIMEMTVESVNLKIDQ